jgi:hypothetical protein
MTRSGYPPDLCPVLLNPRTTSSTHPLHQYGPGGLSFSGGTRQPLRMSESWLGLGSVSFDSLTAPPRPDRCDLIAGGATPGMCLAGVSSVRSPRRVTRSRRLRTASTFDRRASHRPSIPSPLPPRSSTRSGRARKGSGPRRAITAGCDAEICSSLPRTMHSPYLPVWSSHGCAVRNA